ncbi:MAG: poly-beta-1,6-N-acetyl-D-glucosamine biosynthesis protein PgaD [Negativicutes bacterium]|nr:poly-beta-1,6-N-acetyl-D-glucosamine biosynthesis protein PgaD [Negativicutes bacterium]
MRSAPLTIIGTRRERKRSRATMTKAYSLLAIACLALGGLYIANKAASLSNPLTNSYLLANATVTAYLLCGLCFGVLLVKWIISGLRIMVGASVKIWSSTAQTSSTAAPVIDQPQLKKLPLRILEMIFSVSIWAFFIYLIQPLATVLLWIFGFTYLSKTHLFSLSALEGTAMIMEFSAYLAVFFFLSLLSWANWNYWRYGRLNRRKPKPAVAIKELAAYYDVPPARVEEAQAVKLATLELTGNDIRFTKCRRSAAVRGAAILIAACLWAVPTPAWAAVSTTSMFQLGYDQDVIVSGARNTVSVAFPVPQVPLLNGSMVSLTLEPGRFLNDASNFTFYLNDRQLFTLSARELKAKPTLQLPVPANAAVNGVAKVDIVSNLFVTNDICADYQRGHLTYTLRNSSAITVNYNPPSAKTLAQFFNSIAGSIVVIIPDSPSPAEITAGAWAYGMLQKIYPHLPVKLIFEKERAAYPGIPKVWVATTNRLPANLSQLGPGIHVAAQDTVLITDAAEGLGAKVRHLATLQVFPAMPAASMSPASPQQQPPHRPRELIHFGNNSVQEGILTIPADFPIFPALLSEIPKSLKIHLEGHYSPSNVAGKPTRVDVYFNRNLVHSELLDNSGKLNKDISLPPSVMLQARNTLGVEFVYPEETGWCKVKGMVQSAQILYASYFQGVGHFPVDKYTWSNIGMVFNRTGALLLGDKLPPDAVRMAGEFIVLMNSHLPPGVFAFPEITTISRLNDITKADYLIVLGIAGELPEELQQSLPLQRSKDYTIYRADGQSVIYQYQPAANAVLGQIGFYRNIPLISLTANLQPASILAALKHINATRSYNQLNDNIFVFTENSQLLSIDRKNTKIVGDPAGPAWLSSLLSSIGGSWDAAVRFAERNQERMLWGIGIFVIIMIGKRIFARGKH